ncbi:MAG: hypothetical protein ACM30D_14075, partial [Hyphomicrobiales bacterium]
QPQRQVQQHFDAVEVSRPHVAGFKEAAGDGGFFPTGRRGCPGGMRSDRGTWLPFEVIAAQFLE